MSGGVNDIEAADAARRSARIERLIDRLPARLRGPARWLRKPSSRWVRLPVGVLLICGGVLGALPLAGFWMLPAGLALLAEDVPPLKRACDRLLDRFERRERR